MVLEMVSLLNSLPSTDMLPLLQRLNAEADASTVLATLRNAQGANEGENRRNSVSIAAPEAVPAVESVDELAALYYAVYPPLVKSGPDLFNSKPYQELVSTLGGMKDDSPENESSSDARTYDPELCDARLYKLDIAQWTSVDIASDLAAKCISLYLKMDHPLLGHFDPDLFVSDLVSGKTRFCSPLLVNSLLYWGSVSPLARQGWHHGFKSLPPPQY